MAALSLPAGIYNVSDDEPLRRREYVDTVAQALGVAAPKLPPAWLMALGGSLAKLMALGAHLESQASGRRRLETSLPERA